LTAHETGIYDSDGAADTVLRIRESGLTAVREHLDRVNEFGHEPVWSNVADEALPAIDVVAHVMSGVPAVGSQVGTVVADLTPADVADLVNPSFEALDRIVGPESGLLALWKQAGSADEWLACMADLRLRLEGFHVAREAGRPEFLDYVHFVPGDVLVVPLDSGVAGAEGVAGVALVRSVAGREPQSVGLFEILVPDLFFGVGDERSDLLSALTPESVLEGVEVRTKPFPYKLVGRLERFSRQEWPILIDDHSFKPTGNPFPYAERYLISESDRPQFEKLRLPDDQDLESLSRRHFDRYWVPYWRTGLRVHQAVSMVYHRHHGNGSPFVGNGRPTVRRRPSSRQDDK